MRLQWVNYGFCCFTFTRFLFGDWILSKLGIKAWFDLSFENLKWNWINLSLPSTMACLQLFQMMIFYLCTVQMWGGILFSRVVEYRIRFIFVEFCGKFSSIAIFVWSSWCAVWSSHFRRILIEILLCALNHGLEMHPSPAMRISPRKELRVENHKRGRSLESVILYREKDDDLALFNEVQNKERENFLLPSNDFDDICNFSRYNLLLYLVYRICI